MLALGVNGMRVRKVADVVAGFLGVGRLGGVRVLFRQQNSPVLDDRGRIPVDFHPHQGFVEPMSMGE